MQFGADVGEGGACEAEAVEALEAVSENARTISKGLQRQTLAAYAQAARPRTPTGVQPPRPSDLNEERRMEEARMQSTIRAQAPMAEDRSRSKMRQNLERSFKKGQLPYSSSTRCFRCGADHPDSVCRDLHEFLQKQKIPKYKRLPDVEVSFKVRSISDLDSKTGTFLADFLLELHWVDPGLERDTHYTEDYQSQTLQLFPAFESHIFNPEVVLENAVETLVPLPSSESQPVIQAEAIHGLWMRRRVHFKGLLACANISYANFPLDTHAISISVTLKKWQGLTPKVVSPVPEVKEVRNRSKDQKQEDWPGHAVAQDSIHLGDLNFVAWGVWSQHGPETEGQREEDQYELIMVMRRSFRRHFFTFFILSMAVLSGATSLFCPLSIDMLAGRLSINVTVLLSMVAFSVQRPSAIEAVPYNTIHDIFVQVCTLLTATLSLCNLATQLTCFEMTEGCDECVREDLPELCALGSCGSKVLDCYFFYTLLLLLVFIDLGLLLWARHLRSAELRHFRALCKDLGAEQGATRSGWCSWACCRCRHPCRRRVQPLDVRAKVAQSLPRRKTKQLASSGAHRAYGGVPCFFLREKGGRFLPVPGGLCEMMQMEWKDALERVQVKDRASAVPLRRCISRFSRASVGTNAFSRRLAHPTVLEGVETHYMDLGGGEVGYYRYCHLPDAPPLEQVTCMAAEKLEWPGLTEVLEQEDPVRIAELCQSLVSYLVHETGKKNGTAAFARHLEERALEEGKEEASLLVGITGEVAAQLLEGRRPREPLELFLEDLAKKIFTLAELNLLWQLLAADVAPGSHGSQSRSGLNAGPCRRPHRPRDHPGAMKESYTTLAQEENPEGHEEDEEDRKKITQIRLKSNPTVSRCKRCFLAVIRALIFVSATSALLYLQIWWATEYAWYETPANVTGTLNHTSIISSIEENCLVDESVVDLWAKGLAKERTLIAEVHPNSPSPLPVMTWYVSEEVYRNRDGWIPLLSFSARLAKPARVDLLVEQDLNEGEYLKLLEDAFRRNNFLVEEEDLIWTGNYLVGHWHTNHQGMLWNSILGWQYYKPSKEWQFLTAVAFVIMMVSCSTILKFLIREAQTDWGDACQVWITQNDNLWEVAKQKGKKPIKPDTKKIQEKAHPEKAPPKRLVPKDEEKGEASGSVAKKKVVAAEPVEPVEVDVNWEERLCLCSPFFVLDNTLADAYSCEEQVLWAVASAVVHSLTFSICPALPCIACHFMKAWVPLFHFLMGAYGLAVIPLGLSYYFALSHGKLNLTFALLQIFVMTCWVVASVVYIISSLIYLAAVASIDSKLIVDALIPLATVFAYATIVISRLKALQRHYIAAAEGKATKGFLMYETHRLGFSTSAIIVLAIEGVASLFGLFLIQLAIRNMYAGSTLVTNNLVQAAVLPTYALINAMLNLKNEKLHDARGDIQEDLVNTIKEIF